MSPSPPGGFTWDAGRNRYRDARGRLVGERQVRQAVDETIDAAAGDLKADALRLQAGAISLVEWQLRAERLVKQIHALSAAAAVGGWARMTPADWSLVGNRVKAQYAWLDNLAYQIANATQRLDGRFLARVAMYASAGSGTYEAARRRRALAAGAVGTERRLLHGAENHCADCIAYAALGWQKPGTLPGIGENCACRSNCRCRFERRLRPAPRPARTR